MAGPANRNRKAERQWTEQETDIPAVSDGGPEGVVMEVGDMKEGAERETVSAE